MQEAQIPQTKVQTQFNEPALPHSVKNFRPVVSLPAQFALPVLQLQLDLNKPYKALNTVDAFSAVNVQNSDKQITPNDSVTVIEHVGQPLKTRVYNNNQLQKMLFTTAGNDANFQNIGPSLANADRAAYSVTANSSVNTTKKQINYTDFYKDMANEPAPA
ncbi:MAG: hypothetical protein ACRC3B_03445, partial [Bacteroidia bacterium]